MLPDFLSAALRIVSFVALFQAAGAAIFIAMFRRHLAHSIAAIRQVGWMAAIIAMIAVNVHFFLEAARMAGELAGVLDASLQQMVMESPLGKVAALRIGGLLLIAANIRGERGWHEPLTLVGVILTLASFVFIGHTSVHPDRPMLVILLLAHLVAVAFWFGALIPLFQVSAREPMRVAGEVIEAFSAIALWLVPGLLIVGVLIATLLLPNLSVFKETYGELLLAKITGFALLMAFAAANKWRLTPAIHRGEVHAIPQFQRSVTAEYALIVVVLSATAIMTGFFSPEP